MFSFVCLIASSLLYWPPCACKKRKHKSIEVKLVVRIR